MSEHFKDDLRCQDCRSFHVFFRLLFAGYSGTERETAIKELKSLREENIQLKGIIESKDKRIILLEGLLKSKQHVNDSDLKVANKKLFELQNEVDQKSHLIAYLTAQLHQLNVKTKDKVANDETPRSIDVSVPSPYDPSPPREGTPSRLRQRAHRRSVTPTAQQDLASFSPEKLGSHHIAVSDYILQSSLPKSSKNLPARPKQSVVNPARPSHGLSTSRRERELNMLSRPKPNDYKEFLKTGQPDNADFAPRPPVVPLPPISNENESCLTSRRLGNRQKSRIRASMQSTKAGEVEKVIIEPLSSPEKSWRHTQDSKCTK